MNKIETVYQLNSITEEEQEEFFDSIRQSNTASKQKITNKFHKMHMNTAKEFAGIGQDIKQILDPYGFRMIYNCDVDLIEYLRSTHKTKNTANVDAVASVLCLIRNRCCNSFDNHYWVTNVQQKDIMRKCRIKQRVLTKILKELYSYDLFYKEKGKVVITKPYGNEKISTTYFCFRFKYYIELLQKCRDNGKILDNEIPTEKVNVVNKFIEKLKNKPDTSIYESFIDKLCEIFKEKAKEKKERIGQNDNKNVQNVQKVNGILRSFNSSEWHNMLFTFQISTICAILTTYNTKRMNEYTRNRFIINNKYGESRLRLGEPIGSCPSTGVLEQILSSGDKPLLAEKSKCSAPIISTDNTYKDTELKFSQLRSGVATQTKEIEMNEYDDDGTPFDQDILPPDYEQEAKERFINRCEVNPYTLGGISYEPSEPKDKKPLTCFTPIELSFLKVLEVWNDEARNQKRLGYQTRMTEHKIDHQNPSKTLQRILRTIREITTEDWLERQQAIAKPATPEVTTLNFKSLYTDEMIHLVKKYAQMFDPDFEPMSKHSLPKEILDFFCKDNPKQRNGKVLVEATYESWLLTLRDANYKVKHSSKPDAKFVDNIFNARVPSGRLFFDIIGDSLANLENRKEQYISVMWEQYCWWKEWTRNFGAINIGIGEDLYIQNFSAYIMWAAREVQMIHFENQDRDENNLVKVPIGCLRTDSKTFQAFKDDQKRYGYRWDWEKLLFLAQAKRRWDNLHFGKDYMLYVTAEDGTEKPTFLTEEEYEEAIDFGWQTADKIV